MIKVVFVLGAVRSGSTWLNMVLGSHSWAANLGEYYRPFVTPGHPVCRLCEADGLPSCAVFDGIQDVSRTDAYHFAARRLGRNVLIDASKRPEWCVRYLWRADIEGRLVHLVRHPCGFVESETRRDPAAAPEQLLQSWERVNADLESFVETSGSPSILASYDDLADDPATRFPPLCRFIGHEWEPAALSYWKVPHHGLGANGAASAYLKGRKVANYRTWDEGYYADVTLRATAADRRWKERLPAEFIRHAVETPYAAHLARRLGRPWET